MVSGDELLWGVGQPRVVVLLLVYVGSLDLNTHLILDAGILSEDLFGPKDTYSMHSRGLYSLLETLMCLLQQGVLSDFLARGVKYIHKNTLSAASHILHIDIRK